MEKFGKSVFFFYFHIYTVLDFWFTSRFQTLQMGTELIYYPCLSVCLSVPFLTLPSHLASPADSVRK